MQLIGKKMRKKFDDGAYYHGEVTSIDTNVDTKNGTTQLLYHIVYDDDDKEDVDEEELTRILGNHPANTQLSREQVDYTKLPITFMQSTQCNDALGDKVDNLITCRTPITEFSKNTRGMVDEDCQVEKTRAPTQDKNDNIYKWTDDETHTKRTRTVIAWIDEVFTRIRGGPCTNKYEALRACRKVCEISEFGIRLCDGKPHYECVQDPLLKLEEYI